jgi:hypothetical protein
VLCPENQTQFSSSARVAQIVFPLKTFIASAPHQLGSLRLSSRQRSLFTFRSQWFWSVNVLWVKSVSFAMLRLGYIRLPGHAPFHQQMFRLILFSFFWQSSIPRQSWFFTWSVTLFCHSLGRVRSLLLIAKVFIVSTILQDGFGVHFRARKSAFGERLSSPSRHAPNNACSGLGGGPCEKAESRRKHFSVSTVGPPTKPLTRAVGTPLKN